MIFQDMALSIDGLPGVYVTTPSPPSIFGLKSVVQWDLFIVTVVPGSSSYEAAKAAKERTSS